MRLWINQVPVKQHFRTEPEPYWAKRINVAEKKSRKKQTSKKNVIHKEEQQIQMTLNRLKQRDREVRQHELAHKATAGPYAGTPTYSYQRGPDGRLYAIGGQVGLDTSPVHSDPEETVKKAETIKRAALAPANPSSTDLKVAARATQMKLKALIELKKNNSYTGHFSGGGFGGKELSRGRQLNLLA